MQIPSVLQEMLPQLFRQSPVLIDVVGHDARIIHVNPCFETTLGWTQQEITQHQPDVIAECFPSMTERRRALDFIQAAGGEWADFKLRTRSGRVLPMAWAEFPLAGGRVLGVGVLERERRPLGREVEQYLRRLFAPVPGEGIAQLELVRVELRGEDLELLFQAEGQQVRSSVPLELVELSARHGSADLIMRMVLCAVANGKTKEQKAASHGSACAERRGTKP